MRYELTDHEWSAIKPMLPNKVRGVPRVNDRRVLNGIFWVLRSGAPWRDLPGSFGPYTTCYNRFVRWRRAGVWSRIMDALAAGHDAARGYNAEQDLQHQVPYRQCDHDRDKGGEHNNDGVLEFLIKAQKSPPPPRASNLPLQRHRDRLWISP